MTSNIKAPATGFVVGTSVATASGERLVEDLAIGDSVRTWLGEKRRIRWIGRRSSHSDSARSHGGFVLINPDALADGAPRRALTLPSGHAVLVEGKLVAVGMLANGRSIRFVEPSDAVSLVAVEFATHDVVRLEGLPVETYVECGDRTLFDNADEYWRLHPADDGATWAFCAPRLEPGPLLDSIRSRLARRAEALELRRASGTTVNGYVDAADHRMVRGWAFDNADPEVLVTVEVLVDGIAVAQVAADQPREDLKAAGYGNGRAGYLHVFEPSLSPFERHDVTVRIAGTDIPLNNSPMILPRMDAATPEAVDEFAIALEANAASRGETDHALRLLVSAADRIRATLPAPARAPRRSRNAPPLAIVIDDKLPDPTRDAGSQAITSHVASLARLGLRVLFVPADRGDGPCPALALKNVAFLRHKDARSVEDALRRLGGEAAVVYVHRLSNMARYAEVIRRHCPSAKLLYNVADLHFLRMSRQAAISGDKDLAENARLTSERELLAATRADAVITHSSFEAELLARLLPDLVARVIGWKVDGRPAAAGFAARRGLAFIGSSAHKPNVDAANIVVNELAPRLRARGLEIPVTLVGEGLAAALGEPVQEGVVFAGHVPSLAAVLDAVRLTVAPIRFGAGVKGKIVQSYAYGVPCVTTRPGAEGLDLPPELAPTVVGTIDEMVERVAALHEDQAAHRALARASRAFAEARFSAAAVDAALAELVGDRANGNSSRQHRAA